MTKHQGRLHFTYTGAPPKKLTNTPIQPYTSSDIITGNVVQGAHNIQNQRLSRRISLPYSVSETSHLRLDKHKRF